MASTLDTFAADLVNRLFGLREDKMFAEICAAVAERDRAGCAAACDRCAAGEPAECVNNRFFHDLAPCQAGPIRAMGGVP